MTALLAEPRTQQPDLVSIYLASLRRELVHVDAADRLEVLRNLRIRMIAAAERYADRIHSGEFPAPPECVWDYAGVVKGIEGMIGEQS